MASSSPTKTLPLGQLDNQTVWGDYNTLIFIIRQALLKMQTATLVKVISVTNNGDASPVGFVDVMPLVDQIDGNGKSTPHSTIFNLPYVRLQGGANAIILDPAPDDIGLCVFASRDISNVKKNKTNGVPGSHRSFSFSDGVYIGGVLNAAPTQYIQFNAANIKLHSPNKIVLDAPEVDISTAQLIVNASSSVSITTPTFTVNGNSTLNGNSTINGALSQTGGGSSSFSGSISGTGTASFGGNVTANGLNLNTHAHSDPQGGKTGAPEAS